MVRELEDNKILMAGYSRPLVEAHIAQSVIEKFQNDIDEKDKEIKKLKTVNKRFSTIIKNLKTKK